MRLQPLAERQLWGTAWPHRITACDACELGFGLHVVGDARSGQFHQFFCVIELEASSHSLLV